MFGVISKYLKSNHSDLAEWFALKTLTVIYGDLKTSKEQIKNIQAFYNKEVQSCIIKLKFDENQVLDMGSNLLYFLLDFRTKEREGSGRNFERTISDINNSITWIQNNKVYHFHPDSKILNLLHKKLK